MNLPKYIDYLKKLALIAEPVYYDGPLLSVQADENTNIFIFHWLGLAENKQAHQWLIYSVNKDDLRKYFHKQIDELTLLKKAIISPYANIPYLRVDIDEQLVYSQPECYTLENLPEIYQPEAGIFFEKDYANNAANLEKFVQTEIDLETNLLSLNTINSIKKTNNYGTKSTQYQAA